MTALPAPSTVHPDARRIATRLAWLVVGLGALALAIVEVTKRDLGLVPLVPLIAPDLAFLAGLGQAHAHGQHPRRAVPLYNLLHRPAFPVLLTIAVVAIPLDAAAFTAGLAWLAHIGIDRAAGYGLRNADGWLRG